MKEKKFNEFWAATAFEWYDNGFVVQHDTETGRIEIPIKDLCSFKPHCEKDLYNNYMSLKHVLKDAYYMHPQTSKLSLFKRASVLSYTVLLTDPLVYADTTQLDSFFLKQRLAVRIALCSIVQAFINDDSQLQSITKNGTPLFHFDGIDAFQHDGEDSFLESVYKDMYFAEQYRNYNVLTMANVYGLLTILGSNLPFKNSDTIHNNE